MTKTKSSEMVIFTQTFDLLTWLIPALDSFPRNHRFGATERLQNAAYDFQEAIFHANVNFGDKRKAHLTNASAHLDTLRLYLRLAHKWQWLSDGQYEHVSAMVVNIGKLLGGWIRQSSQVNH